MVFSKKLEKMRKEWDKERRANEREFAGAKFTISIPRNELDDIVSKSPPYYYRNNKGFIEEIETEEPLTKRMVIQNMIEKDYEAPDPDHHFLENLYTEDAPNFVSVIKFFFGS